MMTRVAPAAIVAIVANAMMLASARANRTGEPDAMVRLTERELRMVSVSARNSPRELALNVFATGYGTSSDSELKRWLTEQRLASLGVDCRPARRRLPESGGSCGLERRVFVVLEFDGPAWGARIDRLRREVAATATAPTPDRTDRAASLEHEIASGSRLVQVDAGLDPQALRRAHPDRSRYLILPAVVGASIVVGRDRNASLSAMIRPATMTVLAPSRYTAMLSTFGDSPAFSSSVPPRYAVSLAVGGRYEPWIVSIDPIDSASTRH